MKRNLFVGITALLLSFGTMQLKAESNPIASPSAANHNEAARAEVLINRLHEINDMDKSSLSKTDKRELRKEVRSIKSEMSQNGGGVYLSVGAVIIIILLLIILL